MKLTNCTKHALLFAIENEEIREKQLCKDYIRLNPADKERRERDRDLILFGLMQAKTAILKAVEDLEKVNIQ